MRGGCVVVALLALFVQGMEGTTWKVGGSRGWQLNVDYAQWTQNNVFEVGDFLLFTYNKSSENVLEVSAADFASCTTIDPIATYTDGNSTVVLVNYTSRCFISGIPGHCLAGMTLQIHVGNLASAPSPSPTPTPTPLSPSPSPSTTIFTPFPSLPPPSSQQGNSPPPTLPSSAPRRTIVLGIAALFATSFSAALII